jgi:flagellar protein FliO/FliZ
MEWFSWGLGWLAWALLLAGAILTGLWSYRVATTGETSFSFGWLFPPRPEPRLGVMEHARVDSRRMLVLIRRDDVEHLIMTGGPVDVVIETGIAAPREAMAETREARRQEPEPPVFARASRGLGQAVNE